MNDLINRQAAIEKILGQPPEPHYPSWYAEQIKELPSAKPETCEGCKHLNKWENEVEYGYNSPCTECKRRVADHYER